MSLLWLRSEVKPFEKRTPLIPKHAKALVKAGHDIVVERCEQRIYQDEEYADVGCRMVDAGSWMSAPKDAFILGIKELPESDMSLEHRHIYFAHAYKGQEGAAELLQRFQAGGGEIYDLEFLTNEKHRRVASFGVSSGMAGAAVSLLLWCKKQRGETAPFKIPHHYDSKDELVADLKAQLAEIENNKPKVLIIGRYGRCGRGVKKMLSEFDLDWTPWCQKDTKRGGPFPEICDFDILYNCVYLRKKIPPFLTRNELADNKRLSLIVDVSCDPTSEENPLPIYNEITTFAHPTVQVSSGANPVDLVAIDHLPSFLPRESSIDFSTQLIPYLENLLDGVETVEWAHSHHYFTESMLSVLA